LVVVLGLFAGHGAMGIIKRANNVIGLVLAAGFVLALVQEFRGILVGLEFLGIFMGALFFGAALGIEWDKSNFLEIPA